jgi:hypothetical protein
MFSYGITLIMIVMLTDCGHTLITRSKTLMIGPNGEENGSISILTKVFGGNIDLQDTCGLIYGIGIILLSESDLMMSTLLLPEGMIIIIGCQTEKLKFGIGGPGITESGVGGLGGTSIIITINMVWALS